MDQGDRTDSYSGNRGSFYTGGILKSRKGVGLPPSNVPPPDIPVARVSEEGKRSIMRVRGARQNTAARAHTIRIGYY